MTAASHYDTDPIPALPNTVAPPADTATPEEIGDTIRSTPDAGGQPPLPSMYANVGAGGSATQAGRDIVNNFGDVLRERSLRRPLETVSKCFAPIGKDGWERVKAVWSRSRLVVITGARHVGKRTVALRLLSGIEPGTSPGDAVEWPIRELIADWDKPAARMLPVARRQMFFLDLGETTAEEFPEGFGEDLRSYVDQQPGVRLVVTMTEDAWRRCGMGLSEFEAKVSAPPADKVVVAHLQHRGCHSRIALVEGEIRREALTDGTLPRDAARLAAAIEHAPDARLGGEAHDSIDVARVVDEFRAWRNHLREFFSGSRHSVSDRALLISAAVLDGASPLAVWRAATQLLAGQAVPTQASELLVGDDLETQLARISDGDVALFEKSVSLDHVRYGLSAAVMPHVWLQRPQMQPALINWIRTLTKLDGTGRAMLPTIGRRLAELTEVDPEFDPVDTVRSWLDSTPETRQLVADLLTGLAEQDSTLGASIRHKTRTWAYSYGRRESTSSPHLAETVAQMCAGPFGRNNPNACLTRLKWLLAGPASAVIDKLAGKVLRDLAATPDEASRLLTAVLRWHSDSPLAASRGFLALMDPDPTSACFDALLRQATNDSKVGTQIRDGWKAVTQQPELGGPTKQVLRNWAAIARSDADIAEPVEVVLAWVLRHNLRSSSLFFDVLGPASQSADQSQAAESELMKKILSRFDE